MIIFGEMADNKGAKKIVQALSARGIEATCEENPGTGLTRLYVFKEEDFAPALDTFRVHLGFAPEIRPTEEEQRLFSVKLGGATKIFLIIGTFVGLAMMFSEEGPALFSFLFIAVNETRLLEEVFRGEVWRLFTPAFLHFGPIHILFNMICLKDFGSVVEKEYGLKRYLLFFLFVGVLSNLAQYWVMGPKFGGYSGVLFGLLGWLWVYPKINKEGLNYLPKSSVMILMIWFFLCLFGIIPQVANSAHATGLVLGMLTGVVLGVVDGKRFSYPTVLGFIALAFVLGGVTFLIEAYRVDGVFYGRQF